MNVFMFKKSIHCSKIVVHYPLSRNLISQLYLSMFCQLYHLCVLVLVSIYFCQYLIAPLLGLLLDQVARFNTKTIFFSVAFVVIHYSVLVSGLFARVFSFLKYLFRYRIASSVTQPSIWRAEVCIRSIPGCFHQS